MKNKNLLIAVFVAVFLVLHTTSAFAIFNCQSGRSSLGASCLFSTAPLIPLTLEGIEENRRSSRNRVPNKFDSLSNLESYLGGKIPNDFYKLVSQIPMSKEVASPPWADLRWSLDIGLIAARYRDKKFKNLDSFEERLAYVQDKPLKEIAQNEASGSDAIKQLSPAEKYDLLVGDLDANLTNKMWDTGTFYKNNGGIGSWMGLCEGTAASTSLLPEPLRSVSVTDPVYGKKIEFLASDIKALSTLLFSEFTLQVPIVGGRCDKSSIDGEPECESLNPAIWFKALHYLMGLHDDRIFVDVTPTLEVWNAPVVSYITKFQNPITGVMSDNPDGMIVNYLDYKSSDSYKDKRPEKIHSIIGVMTEVLVPAGYTTATEGENPAKLVTKLYRYDLELDAAGIILGGEWHNQNHPDFLWALEDGYLAESYADRVIGRISWDGSPINEEWKHVIVESSRRGQPMGSIVYWLLRRSI